MKTASWKTRIVTRDELPDILQAWRTADETIAFTNGVFDLLHRGHIYSLEEAANLADRLIVGVNSDRSTRLLGKDPDRPFMDENDRAAFIASLTAVDLVLLFDEPTPYELLSIIKPDILVKGDDYRIEDVVGREFAGMVKLIRRLDGFSSTNLVDRIRSSGKP
ncbi:adenylyltransferase/cytidyltransferase family protein [bacterium]|nr:adenylyltransferase/cytidyltransferase family protein [bacterium]